ncbi:m119L [Myxoma virus]|uniref:M119L n=2 Tax=Myxoma virus TaxID=10273 RepID=Q9Q8I2_MYXVL|nr:m119L [Myxoma virus]ACB28914.1 m119L [recombinant virus 6918VP60-T2]AAF15007.1 m119L [Myxoma virus]ACB28742.1 m119L [Myxoma virus]ADI75417.1 M119L [Myxoma virus]ADK63759.1 m119L [Myxoma virus]
MYLKSTSGIKMDSFFDTFVNAMYTWGIVASKSVICELLTRFVIKDDIDEL